ncbi:hypothetical protein ILYODFUR_003132 [Ilyodon furcidens]|uniref:Protein kinase domain-containing protein n=1 Tax=Ilyodon furcidens TaxID=33524 RepID=A0ABV0USJ3_9TELE
MYILLSGNPPFYDDSDEEDPDSRDKNLFLKILSGDYEFDSPYWDDISDSAKTLVASLMDVDQDQRLTAQEAIAHEWISGNAASDKNIKDGVCAQIEKNFAKAKWKVLSLTYIKHTINIYIRQYFHFMLMFSKNCWVKSNPIWVCMLCMSSVRHDQIQTWIDLTQQDWIIGLSQNTGLGFERKKWVKVVN